MNGPMPGENDLSDQSDHEFVEETVFTTTEYI